MGIDVILYAKTDQQLTDSQVRELAVEMCIALGVRPFRIPRYEDPPQHALWRPEPEDIDFVVDANDNPIQDGTGDILRVGLCTSYYGEGYERGNWPEIANAAEWLESRLPGTTMWYGGDDDEHVAPLGLEERTDMWEYFAANGNRLDEDSFGTADAPQCRFCDRAMEGAHLRGCDGSLFYCKGCGYSMLKHRNGRVVLTSHDGEFAVQIAINDAEWANYEKRLTGEMAMSVAAEMCETQAGLAVACECGNEKIRLYAFLAVATTAGSHPTP